MQVELSAEEMILLTAAITACTRTGGGSWENNLSMKMRNLCMPTWMEKVERKTMEYCNVVVQEAVDCGAATWAADCDPGLSKM